MERTYIAIDLKSFYASVECVERFLDPLTTHLVVADASRTEKTICLAVSPALKAYGIPGRPRLFEVVQKVRQVNAMRKDRAPGHVLTGASSNALELAKNPSLGVDYVVAKPQMAHYMEVSTAIYQMYLKYIAPEDIHVYSIDEVFIDATNYLKTYRKTGRELAMTMIRDVLKTTGITATAGIGTNLYLCKIAMDIVAKKIPPDEDGVRIAELNEQTYRELLWEHAPLTDFWRIGHATAKKLNANGMFTMGDIARYSLHNEDRLYQLFGINAELLIDHAWGWEPCTMEAIKAYTPESSSISNGQVLSYPYDVEKGKLIVREMTDLLALDLVDKGLVTDQLTLTVGYEAQKGEYTGELTTDRYGRKVPRQAHGSVNLGRMTSSAKIIMQAMMDLYDRIVDPKLMVRRLYVVAGHVMPEELAPDGDTEMQLDLFTDYSQQEKQQEEEKKALAKERRRQEAVLAIKKKYGKNAILKGMNFEEGATARERNGQVGGHKA